MTRLSALLTALLLAACAPQAPTPLPSPMPAYRSPVGNMVYGLNGQPGAFEVVAYAGNDTENYRCSAGEYVIRALHQPTNTRIYLLKPQGPSVTRPGRRAMTFTVAPDADLLAKAKAIAPDYLLAMTQPGDSFTAASGAHLCKQILPFFWDIP